MAISNPRLKRFLETKRGTAIELLIFFGVSLSTLPLGIIVPILIMIVIFSLRIRKLKSTDLGFRWTYFTLKRILLGIFTAVFYLALFYYVIDPVIKELTHVNLQEVFKTKASLQNLIFWLITSWVIGAFYEELVFRGYLINRVLDLAGNDTMAKVVSIVLSSSAFGFVHYYQGMHGVISAGIIGLFQSALYLIDKKKLAIPCIAHGTYDTIAFIYLYFG